MGEPKHVIEGSTVSFQNVNYCVTVKKESKKILQNVSGLFKPGMNAILGPTGGGKTSLLDILAARKDPVGLSGTVLVDGKPQPSNFKCISGYVVQDDVVMGTLTIRENLMFSANLRLPKSLSQAEKKERVSETITNLGLENCADSKVGNEFIRGVSGGERKRTNIGMELVIAPKVMFLDEPTTGLDASTAGAVMLLVQKLSQKGHTIIFSIHQPRYAIFRLIDSLMLLSLGRAVYHGPAQQALDYFSAIGYECERFNNPADFFLDVINGDSTAVKSIEDPMVDYESIEETSGDVKKTNGQVRQSNSVSASGGVSYGADADRAELQPAEEGGGLSSRLSTLYEKSEIFSGILEQVKKLHQTFDENSAGKNDPSKKISYPNSFLTQMNWVSRRTFLNLIRNPATLFMQVVVAIVFALVVGIIYFQLDNILPQAIQNRVGAFFLIIMNQIFSTMSALDLFIKERKIFMHENISGFYPVSAYFLAKIFCDIAPMRLLPVIVFSCISYFMIGLEMDVGKFFFFILLLFVLTLAAMSLGFLISSSVEIYAIASLTLALCFVLMMIFAGLFVNLPSLAAWIRWLQYLSIFRYGLNGLMVSQFKDAEFCNVVGNTTICNNYAGNNYLALQGVPYQTTWDLWLNVVALFCMGVGLLCLTYIQLRRLKKTS